MNNVCVIGRITKDIELCKTASGLSAVSMFIAINNGKDKEGNDRQADFPKVYVYEKQAENVAKYCKKGSLVAISGNIKTRSWEKNDGTKGYETYIRASRVQFLDNKSEGNNTIPDLDNKSNSQIVNKAMNDDTDPFRDFANEVELSEDDYPF